MIPFLRLPELKSILLEACAKVKQREAEYEKTVHTMNQLLDVQQNLTRQRQLMEQLKLSLIGKLLR